jgi:3-oxoacyl-[acyl-carrier protein] reductase
MFENKVVLVTGGSRGIGRQTCLEFARRGAQVAFSYAGNTEAAKETEDELRQLSAEVFSMKANSASAEEASALIDAVIDRFGHLDILVNNAGITRDDLAVRMSEEDFDAVIETNLRGVFLCMKYAGKAMMRKRYGRIINMGSVVGLHGNAGQINYAASKAGVVGMTKSFAKELGRRNVTVNAVAPGFIQTDMTAQLSEDQVAQVKKEIPLGVLGTAQDVANAICFLASDEAAYITGQVLQVDGGLAM